MKLNFGVKWTKCVVLVTGLLLVACTPKPPQTPTAGMEAYKTLQTGAYSDQILASSAKDQAQAAKISNALLLPLAVKGSNSSANKEPRFNVAAKDVPAK